MNDRRPVATPDEAATELRALSSPEPEPTEFPRYFVGTPDRVRAGLLDMAGKLNIRELVVSTITHDPAARLRSYTLLAEAFTPGCPGLHNSPAAGESPRVKGSILQEPALQNEATPAIRS